MANFVNIAPGRYQITQTIILQAIGQADLQPHNGHSNSPNRSRSRRNNNDGHSPSRSSISGNSNGHRSRRNNKNNNKSLVALAGAALVAKPAIRRIH